MDNVTNEWARMPMSWERTLPHVKEMLRALGQMFPQWSGDMAGYQLH